MPRIKVSPLALDVTPYKTKKPAAVSVRPAMSIFEAIKSAQESPATGKPIRMPGKVRSPLD